jgi:hypothetical protein
LRKNVKKKKKVSMAAEKGRKNQIRSQLEKWRLEFCNWMKDHINPA